MTTPTDDEIVAHILAQDGITTLEAYVRTALRLAREGLPVPVKDEAVDLHNALGHCIGGHERIAFIRTFLAARDAERDAEVAELVAAARDVCGNRPSYFGEPTGYERLTAALAKLERKP